MQDVSYLKEELKIIKLNRDRIVRENATARAEFRAHYQLLEDVEACLKRVENGIGSDRDRGVINNCEGRGKYTF